MSDSDLAAIRQKKIRELQKRLAAERKKTEETETGEIDPNNVLDGIFKGRAWEVFHNASYQFPDAMSKVKAVLVRLALAGRLKEVTGEQLYVFLRNLGLRVKLDTKIRFSDHGELRSLADKLRKDFSE